MSETRTRSIPSSGRQPILAEGSSPQTHTERASPKNFAYEEIRHSILNTVIASGSSLPERELAQRYGISRTLVREVLYRLESDGLAQRFANRGTFVRRLEPREIVDIFYAREAVEGMAARLAADRHSLDQFLILDGEFMRLDREGDARTLSDMVQIGRALHDMVVEATGNQSLIRAYRSLRNEVMLIRSLTQTPAMAAFSPPSIMQHETASYHEHSAILNAVKSGRGDIAEEAMRHHLVTARVRLFEQLVR